MRLSSLCCLHSVHIVSVARTLLAVALFIGVSAVDAQMMRMDDARYYLLESFGSAEFHYQ